MKHFGTMPKDKKDRKNHLKHLAQQRFPSVKITLATADAILLANQTGQVSHTSSIVPGSHKPAPDEEPEYDGRTTGADCPSAPAGRLRSHSPGVGRISRDGV